MQVQKYSFHGLPLQSMLKMWSLVIIRMCVCACSHIDMSRISFTQQNNSMVSILNHPNFPINLYAQVHTHSGAYACIQVAVLDMKKQWSPEDRFTTSHSRHTQDRRAQCLPTGYTQLTCLSVPSLLTQPLIAPRTVLPQLFLTF